MHSVLSSSFDTETEMEKARIQIGLTLTCLLFSSCDLMKYHPYVGDFDGERHLTQKNLKQLNGKELKEEFCFAFISDTQRRYDDTDEAVESINGQANIDFVLHGGDLTDFGVTEEFVWMRDCLAALRVPYLTVIGNHDFLGNGEFIYQEMYGPLNYAFTVGHVRFEMLNTVALELDYSTPVPDFGFMENELHYIDSLNTVHPDSLTRTVFVMHSRPGDEQFNNNVLLPFDRYLQLFPEPFCLNGHNHRFETLEPYDDGIYFYGVGAIKDRSYYLFTIHPDNTYDVEKITF